MGFYPAFLDLSRKPCLVVGGGAVALQKTKSLKAAGARVTVVAAEFRPEFRRLAGVRLARRGFRPADLGSGGRRPWIVVAATDDEALHRRIATLCRARGIWANVADRPPLCDFIVPAVVRRGPVTLAVSTGGRSPALAKFIGGRLRAMVGEEYGRLGRLLSGLRPRLRGLPLERRVKMLESVISEKTLALLRKGGRAAVDRLRGRIRAAIQEAERESRAEI